MKQVTRIKDIDGQIEHLEKEIETLKFERENNEKEMKKIFYESLTGRDLFYNFREENLELWISDISNKDDYNLSLRLLNIKIYSEDVLKDINESIRSVDKNLVFVGFALNSEGQINLHYTTKENKESEE